MTYNTLAFALFLLAVLLLYFIVPKKGRWIVLLTASYAFYLFNNSFLVVFILITTLSVYLCGRCCVALKMRKFCTRNEKNPEMHPDNRCIKIQGRAAIHSCAALSYP